MKVALIACSNGLGHVNRMLSLCQSLVARGAVPTIIAPIDSLRHLCKIHDYELPEYINYKSNSSYMDWIDSKKNAWTKSSPNLDSYDIVVSDNLIEVLEFRSDTILSGSFFWHEALPSIPLYKKNKAIRLIKKYRPKMIATKLFASDYLEEYTHISYVGIYSHTIPVFNNELNRNNILIACGKGGKLDYILKQFIEKISNEARAFNGLVYLEPKIYKSNMPYWIKPADFSSSMFSTIGAAIIRPGVGTVSDCIIHRIRMFMVYERENLEMQSNVNKILEKKMGEFFYSIDSAWDDSVDFVKNNLWLNYSKQKIFIDLDGAKQATKIILNR